VVSQADDAQIVTQVRFPFIYKKYGILGKEGIYNMTRKSVLSEQSDSQYTALLQNVTECAVQSFRFDGRCNEFCVIGNIDLLRVTFRN
jgi:hypothetical protein